ncbi:replication initiator protein [Acinetobacter baumannii]|nr:replication initiator protein [Acinetobacter baumannii]OLV29580.1 replication initiator protein [Acinetobacter baumannii]OLV29865.1 replication initiator protein [Acinetobacter baumannii]OLV39255.1 replication initiator protein [Acinetobacter baumannii]OLV42185.1 replication initiator protein [Acinetobacter baumannii]
MGSCAAPSAKGDDKFITTDYLQQCRMKCVKIRSRISLMRSSPPAAQSPQ